VNQGIPPYKASDLRLSGDHRADIHGWVGVAAPA